MLSKHNIEKLNMNGLYRCDANPDLRGGFYSENIFHCCNWTFTVTVNKDGEYYMRDTYWSDSSSFSILLTDENIDDFDFIFDKTQVKQVNHEEAILYKNPYMHIAIDSGGVRYNKSFVNQYEEKDKQLVLNRLDEKIEECERHLRGLKRDKERLQNDEIKPEWAWT